MTLSAVGGRPRAHRLLLVALFLACQVPSCRPRFTTEGDAEQPRWTIQDSLYLALQEAGDSRAALVAVPTEAYSERGVTVPVGESFVWNLDLPSTPTRLDFGLWIELPDSGAHDVFIDTTIELTSAGGGTDTVFRKTFRAGDYWRDYELTPTIERLARHHVRLGDEGGQATLTFSSRQVFPDAAAPAHVIWANPLLRAQEPAPRPNIVLICLDTLRHDRVIGGTPDDPKILPPAMASLADDGVVFTNAVSHSPWTLPSVVSVLTGLPPAMHGAGDILAVLDDPDGVAALQGELAGIGQQTEAWEYQGVSRVYSLLSDSTRTLPEYLGDSYESYLLNSKNGWLRAARLHHRFDASHIFTGDDATAARLGALWTGERTDSNFLIYYHLMYVHEWPQTYLKHDLDPVLARRIYDAGVAVADQTVGEILGDLRERGLYDDSLIVLWSDHGEHLWDPGWGIQGHGNTLSEVLLKVPLIVKYPGGTHAGTVVDDLVRLRDIFPTVMAAAGSPGERPEVEPARARAVDLGEVIAGRREIGIAFSEFGSYSKGMHGVQRGRYRLIVPETESDARLLDLREDRVVETPLDAVQMGELAELEGILEAYLRHAAKWGSDREAIDFDDHDIQSLKALGYLQ